MTRKTTADARPAPRKTSTRAKAKTAASTAAPTVPSSRLRHDLTRQTSRFALLSALGLAAAGAGSLIAPGEAMADCVLTNGVTVCGNTTTTNTSFPGGYPNNRETAVANGNTNRAVVNAGATVNGHGLALSNGGVGGVSVTNDGVIRVDAGNIPTFGGNAALNLLSVGGPITYSGGGDIINEGQGDALRAEQQGAGSIDLNVAGDTRSATDSAIYASNTNTGGDINVVVSGDAEGNLAGIRAEGGSTAGAVNVTSSGSVRGGAAGIIATQGALSAGDLNVAASGPVEGGVGIEAIHFGTGDISVSADGPVAGTGSFGLRVFAQGGGVDLAVGDVSGRQTGILVGGIGGANPANLTISADDVTSDFDTGIDALSAGAAGLTVSGDIAAGGDGIHLRSGMADAAGTGDMNVVVSGEITAGDDGAVLYNNGSGAITALFAGPIVAENRGVSISDTADGGAIDLTTGDITGNGDAISINSQSLDGTIDLTVDGDLSGGTSGLTIGQNNADASGAIDVAVNGAVSGRYGVSINSQGTSTIDLGVDGPVTGSEGDGVNLTSEGAITVRTGAVTGAQRGVIAHKRGAQTGGITLTGSGDIVALAGRGVDLTEDGLGSISVLRPDDAITGTDGDGVRARVGAIGGNIGIDVGSVTATGTDPDGGPADGVDALSDSATGDVTVEVRGPVSAQGGGVVAGLTNANATGDVGVRVRGDVRGRVGVRTDHDGLGDVSIVTDGAVRGDVNEGIYAEGRRNVTVVANGTVTGATRGATVIGGEAGVGAGVAQDISVTGTGGFVGEAGDALNITNRGRGAVLVAIEGDSVGATNGIVVTDGADGGDISVTAGGVTARNGIGISATSNDANVSVTTNGAVSATDIGILANGFVDVSVVAENSVTGSTGIQAVSNDDGTVRVTANGAVTGTVAEGIVAAGNRATSLTVNGAVTGATHGATVVGGEFGVDVDIEVAGSGSFEGRDGNALQIQNNGSGDVLVNLTGDLRAGGQGAGLLIRDNAEGGNVDVTVGAVTAARNGVDVDLLSRNSDIEITTSGDVQAGRTGIFARLGGANTGGTIDITAEGDVSGRDGIIATSLSRGTVSVVAGGDVSGTSIGLAAEGAGAVDVAVEGIVRGGDAAGIAIGGSQDEIADISVRAGGFVATNGPALQVLNRGEGNVTVDISGATSAGRGHGVWVTDSAEGGNVDITTGAVSATDGSAIVAVADTVTGDVNVTANGDLTATDTGVIAGLRSGLAEGDVTVRTNGAVRGAFGVSASNAGIGDVNVTANGDIIADEFEGLRVEGRRNVNVEVNANVSGARNGAVVIGGEAGVPTAEQDITVRGTGGFTSGAGNALNITNRGGGDVLVDISGETHATNGSGVAVTARAEGGDISVTTGAVTTVGDDPENIGLDLISQSTRGNITAVANGAISAGGNGVGVALVSTTAEGDIDITTRDTVSGRDGINARNAGTGDIRISADQAVTGTVENGIRAEGRRSVTVEVNDTVSGARGAIAVLGGESGLGAGVVQDITVRGSGGFVSTEGPALAIANRGYGDVLVNIAGATSSADGHGIVIDDTAEGGDIAVTAGSVTASRDGVQIDSDALAGNISITTNGDVSAGEFGIFARLFDENATGSVDVTANGDVVGRTGIQAVNFGRGDVSVTAEGDVTGTNVQGFGLAARGRRDVTVRVNGTVTGDAIGALVLAGEAGAASDVSVTGEGGFVGTNGSALGILNNGTGDTTVNISGASSATGGSGIVVQDTASGGDVTVTTGAVSAVAGSSALPAYGVNMQLATQTGSIDYTANGDVSGTTGGMIIGLLDTVATGTVEVTANERVEGGFGINAFNNGFGALAVTANGDVTGTTGRGIQAIGNAGVSVTANGLVSGAAEGLVVQAGGNGAGDISVTGAGGFAGGTGHGMHIGNLGSGSVLVDVAGPISSAEGDGLQFVDLDVGGDIDITVGDVTALEGIGLNLQSTSRTADLSVTADGAVRGGEFGVLAMLVNNTGGVNLSAGDLSVTTNGAVSGRSGILAQGGGQGGSVVVNTVGDVTGTAGTAIQALGSGDISVTAEGRVEGSLLGLIAAGEGDISVSGAGDFIGNEGSGVLIDSQGDGDVVVDVTGLIAGDGSAALAISKATNGGDITVATGDVTATGNNASHGVLIAAETGGGDISVTTRGTVQAAGTGVIAQQASDTATGDVSIVTEGTVTGREGISAINLGEGSISVHAQGEVTGTAGRGISARGRDVDIIADATVTGDLNAIGVVATGDTRIRAQALNAANGAAIEVGNIDAGAVDIVVAGPAIGAAGIIVNDTAAGGDIRIVVDDVTATGDVFNAISVVSNSEASNIDVVANGALRAGDVGIRAVRGAAAANAVGAISVTARETIVADTGIQAVNRGTGDVTIDAAGAITARDGNGVVASAVNGEISVTTGDVSAAGAGSVGVFAQRTGATAGDVTVNARNVIGVDGVIASNSGAGDVSVTADSVQATGDHGVAAQKLGAGLAGDVSVNVRNASGRRGVLASNQGAGAATVLSTGTITASESDGVLAFAAGAGGVSVEVNNVSGGTIGVHTSNNGSGAANIVTHGLVTGSEAGILAASSGDQTVSIRNAGTVRNTAGRSDGIAIQAGGGAIDLANTGTILGRLIFQGDSSSFVNRGGWNAIGGLSDFQGSDDRMVNDTTGVITGGLDAAIRDTSLWQGLESFRNAGVIDLGDGGIGDVISTSANTTFAGGSILQVDIGGTKLADVFRTTGTLTLEAGARLEVNSIQSLSIGRRYIVASATSLVGEFDFEDRLISAFVGLRDGYTASDAYLELWQMRAFEEAGDTWNRRETGRGVDSLPADNALHEAVLVLPDDAAARAAFDQLSGEIHPAMRRAMSEGTRLSREAVLDRLESEPGNGRYWGQAFYQRGEVPGDGNAATTDLTADGILIGADGSIAPNVTVGFAAGWMNTDVDLDARNSTGTALDVNAMGYAGVRMDRWSLRGGVGYAWTSIDTDRSVAFPGVTDRLRAEYEGSVLQAFIEAAYRMPTNGGRLEPFVNVTTVHANTDAFRETGGVARIEGEGVRDDLTLSTAGFRIRATDGGALSARGMVGVRHMNGDMAPTGRHHFPDGDTVSILSNLHSDMAMVATFEADWRLTPWLSLGAAYEGAHGTEGGDHAVRGQLKVAF